MPVRQWTNLLLHMRPVEVPERTLRFSLTWGLGGAATLLLLLLFGTGLLLKFAFEPVPEQAYESVLYLQSQIPFGRLIRNLHRWSGNLLLLAAFLHLLRVFYTGAIDTPRRGNWTIGIGLFALAVLANFTGYLLPWDQIAYWAITIGGNMASFAPLFNTPSQLLLLGGIEVGQNTLLRFYVLHVILMPLVAAIFLAVHFWRIRKDGGISGPL